MRQCMIIMFEKNELYPIGPFHFQQSLPVSNKSDLMTFVVVVKSDDTLSGQSIMAPVFLLGVWEIGWHIYHKNSFQALVEFAYSKIVAVYFMKFICF